MTYFEEYISRHHDEVEYLAALDRATGAASLNKCGVRIILYRDGDIVIQASPSVSYGTTRVVEET